MALGRDRAGQRETRVLLVEDSPEERASIRRQLEAAKPDAGIVGEAGVDAEALGMLEALQPDVVLMGLSEPLARPLRILESLSVTGRAPIIAVSSSNDRESMRKAMRAGAREYLVRPLKAAELASTIDMVIELEQRRSMLLSRGPTAGTMGEVICVLGAKGGIGKTTVATNLAVALAIETRRKVGLLDLNLEMGDVPIMLDVVPAKTLADAADSIERLDPELLKVFLTPHQSGVQILAASREFRRNNNGTTNEDIGRVVEVMAQSFDYVVVDTAPRLRGTFPAVLERCNMVLLISSPDVPSLKNTKLMLEGFRWQKSNADKVKLVLNDPYHLGGGSADEASKVLEYPVFWTIPYDVVVGQCIRVGQPPVLAKQGAKFSRSMTDLARTISGESKTSKGLLGLFKR